MLSHLGVQLILAYSWGKVCYVVEVKGRSGMFYSVSSPSFLFLFLPYPSLSSILVHIYSLSLGENTK